MSTEQVDQYIIGVVQIHALHARMPDLGRNDKLL